MFVEVFGRFVDGLRQNRPAPKTRALFTFVNGPGNKITGIWDDAMLVPFQGGHFEAGIPRITTEDSNPRSDFQKVSGFLASVTCGAA